MTSLVLVGTNLDRIQRADRSLLRRAVSYFARRTPVTGRYTAGLRIEEGAKKAAALQREGMNAIVNILGEHHREKKGVEENVQSLLYLIYLLQQEGLREPAISLKPTQLGLMIDEEYCQANMFRVVRAAVDAGLFVWTDAESAETTDFTKRTSIRIAREFRGRTGVAVQANLKRSEAEVQDYQRITEEETVEMALRLVRGIYREKREIAYTEVPEMHASFARLMGLALRTKSERFKISVGSHHPDQIIRALATFRKRPELVKDLQFLLGAVTTEHGMTGIPKTLVGLGGSAPQATIYVPCGPEFYAYSIRRLNENPGAIWGFLAATRAERKNLGRIGEYLEGKLSVDLDKPDLPITDLRIA